MKVHNGTDVKIFARAWIKVISEKTYRLFWKISARSGSEGKRMLCLLRSSHNSLQHHSYPQSPYSRPGNSIPTHTLPSSPCLCSFHSSESSAHFFPPRPQDPQIQIPHITWPSLKVPKETFPELLSQKQSLSHKVPKTICTSLKAYPFLQGTIFIYVYIQSLWTSKYQPSSKISAGPLLLSVYTTSTQTWVDTCPSTMTSSPLLHNLLLRTPKPLFILQSYGSLKVQSPISDACWISAPSCPFKPQTH